MAKPKEESPKPEDVVVGEPEQSPLDIWLNKLPKHLIALVTAESSKERRHVADGLIAELETLRKPV